MGAWGISTFENDQAADWIETFLEAPSVKRLHRALAAGKKRCESPEGVNALAAAEIVAAMCSRPTEHFLDTAYYAELDLDRLKITGQLVDLAIEAVINVRESSELRDLWAETSGSLFEWEAEVDELLSKLRPRT